MGKINVLSFAVANLIAAGEVVDRPASVIKELMENAIDSGASRITVEIQNGGVTLMRVRDNGCGMDADDLPVAVRRHATSKIHEAADLDGISTLGFRGEALAAIAAVSELRIISRVHGSPTGAAIEVSGGEVRRLSEQGCSEGTTVMVENLFFNVPARRKFLKKDVTEATAVGNVVEKVALSRPDIAFDFIMDGKCRLQTTGDGKLYNTLYALYGRDYARRLLEVEYEYDGISVHGYVGRSDNVKPNRNGQTFYINDRLVKSRTVMAALEQAFSSYMPQERFPVCTLFINISPRAVDVNVHPAKLEVKFSNEKPVFEAVYYAVKKALESNVTRPVMPVEKLTHMSYEQYREIYGTAGAQSPAADGRAASVGGSGGSDVSVGRRAGRVREKYDVVPAGMIGDMPESAPETAPPEPERAPETAKMQVSTPFEPEKAAKMQASTPFEPEKVPETAKMPAPTPSAVDTDDERQRFTPEAYMRIEKRPQPSEPKTPPTPPAPPVQSETTQPQLVDEGQGYRIIGEAFRCYVLVERGEQLLLIDKHAAHERIIFERLKVGLRSAERHSQRLMLPLSFMLTSDEVMSLEAYRDEVEAIGFRFDTEKYTVNVTEIPESIELSAVEDIFMTLASQVRDQTGIAELTRELIFERALYQASCKAAIKGGREYSDEHIKWLVEQLMLLPDITFCPHGRPVAMIIKKSALDRQFKRT